MMPEEGEEFLHWIDGDSGAVLDDDRTLALLLENNREVIAEYVGVPLIRVEDVDGVEIATLGSFSAMEGEYSEEKSYYAGGVSLTNPSGYTLQKISRYRKKAMLAGLYQVIILRSMQQRLMPQ
jgi:hypothetical protein